jgi:hypothetical protein
MRRLALILPLLITCGFTTCARRPDPPRLPEVVHVPVKVYVALPPELTADCAKIVKRNNTYGESIRLANSRLDALDECTKRMREIRALQPKP